MISRFVQPIPRGNVDVNKRTSVSSSMDIISVLPLRLPRGPLGIPSVMDALDEPKPAEASGSAFPRRYHLRWLERKMSRHATGPEKSRLWSPTETERGQDPVTANRGQ